MQDSRTAQIGTVKVTLLNAGDMRLVLKNELAVPEDLWRPQYADLFERPDVCPSLSVLIESGEARVLVDSNDYRATVTPDSEYALPNNMPPPSIPDQLASLGIQRADITHVVITHAHWDHFAGVTTPAYSIYIPTYPQARYYLGAADWTDAEMQSALQDETSLEVRTLAVLWTLDVLQLVDGPLELAEGITILPAPGETAGHQIVRVQSDGETLYAVGDLVHHAIEVAHPDWMVEWADAETMLAARRWLFADAVADRALLTAAHIAPFGRIEQAGDGWLWHDV